MFKIKMAKIERENSIEEFSNNNGRIILGDALEVLKQIPDESIDLIFVDPPYGKIKIKTVIDKILSYNVLNDNGIIVCEYEDEVLEENYDSLSLIKYRKYGKTHVSIYKNMR